MHPTMKCEHCGGRVGNLGHRCETAMCLGTSLRAEHILETGVDATGTPIDDVGYGHLRRALQDSVATKGQRK